MRPLVELAPGITVPPEFQRSVGLDNPLGRATITIETDPDERQPRLRSFTLRYSEPPLLRQLAKEIRLFAEEAVAYQANSEAMKRRRAEASTNVAVSSDVDELEPGAWAPSVLRIDSAELADVERAAIAHVRPKPGRPHVSDEFKLQVLEVWESGGIPAAKAETGLAERTLRRYIADAKKLRGDS